MTGIELETEFAQARQREARELRHRHRRGLVVGHPDWQLRQRAVRLADGQCDSVAAASRDHDRFTAPGMEPVADDHLARLIVGIMKLPRPPPAPS